MYIRYTRGWKFSANTLRERVLVIQTSLRQEKSVFLLAWSKIEWTKRYRKSCDLYTIFLECQTLSSITFNIKRLSQVLGFHQERLVWRAYWCLKINQVQTVCHKLEALRLGSSELVDCNNQSISSVLQTWELCKYYLTLSM